VSGFSALAYVWSNSSLIATFGAVPAPIVYLPNGPYPAGTVFPVYGQIQDPFGNGIPNTSLQALTLTIVDTLTGQVINDVSDVNILNTGRGTVDQYGNLLIINEAGDTAMGEVPGAAYVQRSYLLSWTYTTSLSSAIGGFAIGGSPIGGTMIGLTGAQQINFTLIALGAPSATLANLNFTQANAGIMGG
jgi:hypothetical protein